jgi:hypothetical protein
MAGPLTDKVTDVAICIPSQTYLKTVGTQNLCHLEHNVQDIVLLIDITSSNGSWIDASVTWVKHDIIDNILIEEADGMNTKRIGVIDR